jgi:sulfate transport system substrate-binding protein
MRFISAAAVLVGMVSVLGASGCGGAGAAGAPGGDGKLTLVAYSTPQEAYEEIIPAFEKTPAGKGVSFDQSYGSSGEQSRAVEAGLPADVVALSLEPDITRLVDAGLVGNDWNAGRYRGMVTDSVVVFAVRKGNPKGIRTWDDLVRPGVEVITPNAFTSGGARWNVMAAYGAQLKRGKSPEEALAYLRELFSHVSVQDKSARESLQTFAGGKGDVLLAYENEAITAQEKGEELDYVVPDETILVENPVAVTSESGSPENARAFVTFLRSPKAQRIFGDKGYRPVVKSVFDEFRYPIPPGLFTIDDLGGWADVSERFFDRESGLMSEIENDLGVSVEPG